MSQYVQKKHAPNMEKSLVVVQMEFCNKEDNYVRLHLGNVTFEPDINYYTSALAETQIFQHFKRKLVSGSMIALYGGIQFIQTSST